MYQHSYTENTSINLQHNKILVNGIEEKMLVQNFVAQLLIHSACTEPNSHDIFKPEKIEELIAVTV